MHHSNLIFTKQLLMGPRSPIPKRVPPTPAPSSATASSRSSHRLPRARSRLYLRRSSSPSSARLLPGHDQEEFGDDENPYEDEGADFYASQVIPFVDEEPLSPSYSIAYTQSDIQTPIRGRYDSFRNTMFGVVDEDRERELAEAAQMQLLQRVQSHHATIYVNGQGDEDGLHTRDSDLVGAPFWMAGPELGSPPPRYTSGRGSPDAVLTTDARHERTVASPVDR